MSCCRMEKLGLQTWAGKAKCVGAILCVGGALATSLYKGKEFYIGHHSHHTQAQTALVTHKTHILRGTFFLVCSCFSYTAWFIVQVSIPSPLPYTDVLKTGLVIESKRRAISIDSIGLIDGRIRKYIY